MTEATETSPPVAPAADDSARQVFLAWERRRLAYNAALAAIVLALGGSDLHDPDFRGFLVKSALVANLFFCLGPVAEGYLVLLGADRRTARLAVFVPGLLVGCLLAIGSLFIWRMRGFD